MGSHPNGTRREPEAPTIFPLDWDNRIPGEVIIKLQPEVVPDVTVSVPGPDVPLLQKVNRLGIPDLDSSFEHIGVESISHLFFPSPPSASGEHCRASRSDDAYYRIKFAPGGGVKDVENALRELTDNKIVADAAPNRWVVGTTVDTDGSDRCHPDQWGLVQIDCPAAWEHSIGSSEVQVAVIDSGVDLNHRDLRPHLLLGKSVLDIGIGQLPDQFIADGALVDTFGLPWDEVGHGTHVAGTISCTRRGVDGVAGVTHCCSVIPVRVLTRALRAGTDDVIPVGTKTDSSVGIRWAVNQGAQILNLSYGDPAWDFYETDAIAYAVEHDVVVVAAAGNIPDPSRQGRFYPAGCEGVIGVAATDSSNKLCSKSNYGDHVTVCAPGERIRSTFWGGRRYASTSGTSTAAPHVSGLAALLLSVDPTLTAPQVAAIIRETATPLQEGPRPDQVWGWGVVNANAAVKRALGAKAIPARR
ncbi:S8 family serine peptidase [Streptomyces sp. NPDC002766]|uniref:S8 family serine peptidase n=1 Tax=Streptomyces sp. NPDC002766 TaxID=3154429 RepID=UPI003317EAAB